MPPPRPPLAPVQDIVTRLQSGFGDLATSWQTTKKDWTDPVADQFEKDHLQTLGPALHRLTTELQIFQESVRAATTKLEDIGSPR